MRQRELLPASSAPQRCFERIEIWTHGRVGGYPYARLRSLGSHPATASRRTVTRKDANERPCRKEARLPVRMRRREVMSEPRSEKTFRERCLKAEEDVTFYTDDATTSNTEYEDDGYLHVRRFGVRAVFNVSNSQSLSGAEQNENTRRIMGELGLTSKIASRVLAEEIDEDAEGYCHECGAPQ